MSAFSRGFEFDAMARRPLYAACPLWLLEHCNVGPVSTVVDLGCGSGIFTEFVLKRFPAAPSLKVIAIDPSEFELEILRRRIDDPRVTTVIGRAQEVIGTVSNVDTVVMCNVLHQIPLKERGPVFEAVFALLRPGGTVGANTLFYEGAISEGTSYFYTLWMMHARLLLQRRSMRIMVPEQTPVALQQLDPEQHRKLLEKSGFTDVVIEEIDTPWSAEDWEALSRYSVFIQGALGPDIDLEGGSEALIEGMRAAYRELGLESVSRGWLHFAARKPG